MAKEEVKKVNTILHVCGKTVEVASGIVKNKDVIEDHVKKINKKAMSNADAALKKQVAAQQSQLEKQQALNETQAEELKKLREENAKLKKQN